MNRIIKIKQVVELTSLSRSTIYKMISEKRFPESKKLYSRRVGWNLEDIDDWIKNVPNCQNNEVDKNNKHIFGFTLLSCDSLF